MYNNRIIFKTSDNDEIIYLKDSILINFSVNRNGISTSELNSCYKNDFRCVFNHHLSQANIDFLENHNVKEYLIKHCSYLDTDPNFSTGLITLANMSNVDIVSKNFKKLNVTAISTAGVRTNASRAGDDASYYEENGNFQFCAGTINTILIINSKLDSKTLTQAFMTATEAKTVALNNLRIASQFSNFYATGTGTDGLAIFSNLDSSNVLTNAGKHSKLGELIANCVIESITKAISKQVWITNKSQSNVLMRLNRYKLDINNFYKDLNENKVEFIQKLQIDVRKQENVAITSSVLNLIDEIDNGLIEKKDARKLAINIVKENCNSYPIRKILYYWISYFM